MSLHTSLSKVATSVKTEALYKSPPSSLSDLSQPEGENSRGRRQNRERSFTAKADDESCEDKENGASASASDKPRKRKRSRKGLDKNFPCPHQDCGKSYSRAEHLYRHQLNHTPKKIYRCDQQGCERKFVRQDLCTRHRERHTARGSHLQRKEPYLSNTDGRPALLSPMASQRVQLEPVFRPSYLSHPAPGNEAPRVSTVPLALSLEITHMPSRMIEPQRLHSSNTTPLESHMRPPNSYSTPMNPDYSSMINRSNNSEQFYDAVSIRGYDPPNSARSVSYDTSQRPDTFNSVENIRSQRLLNLDPRASRSSTHTLTSPATWHASPSLAHTAPTSQTLNSQPQIQSNPGNSSYIPHQSFPPILSLPPPVFSSIPQASSQVPTLGYTSKLNTSISLDAPSDVNMSCPNGMNLSLVDRNGRSQPAALSAGDTYAQSPLLIAEDFAAWFFGEANLNTASPDGHRHGSISSNATAFMNDSDHLARLPYGDDGTLNGQFAPMMPPQNQMAVTSILDPALPQTTLSEEKRQDLLEFIIKRFNETDHAPVNKQKEDLLDGDRDEESHVLSLRMMQTYIGSYWYHFHPQMPILHKPTFSADKAQNLLLIAVIAIGASCLDKVHGLTVTKKGAELSNFLAWHLRWEILKDGDFTPPASLWVFQALLLLEIYEKMYSTRVLHERAHIHHGSTLTLMRRGSSLIGRSALDSPPLIDDETTGITANGSQTTMATRDPDQWWNHWITNEATRRAAFAAFIIDSIHATMFGHQATMVAHEMKLELPVDESLWSATSSAEVGRIEASLKASGVRPVTFFSGLKNTLSGKTVRTNSFGRTALMAGLLSVSWHMNQRDIQVRALGALTALGGRDKWRSTLTKAFDHWRRDFDQNVGKEFGPAPTFYQPPGKLDEENVFENRTVLHHLAHMAMHVDIVSCQIFAKADKLLGRTTLPSDYTIAQKRIREYWAPKASARDATFFSLKFLGQVLSEDIASSQYSPNVTRTGGLVGYSARDDFLLNRPWVLYFAALIVWSYGYALDGPLKIVPDMTTVEQQKQDMRRFLRTVGAVKKPDDLGMLQDRNACMGLLYVLRDMFKKCRWELLHEAARLLTNCIAMLEGSM